MSGPEKTGRLRKVSWAIGLAVLVAVAMFSVLPSRSKSLPDVRPGLHIPATTTGEWMLWYEDESLEDCTVLANLGEDQKQHCMERYYSALPHKVSSDECTRLMVFYNQSRAAEEFECAKTRPDDEESDDY